MVVFRLTILLQIYFLYYLQDFMKIVRLFFAALSIDRIRFVCGYTWNLQSAPWMWIFRAARSPIKNDRCGFLQLPATVF